MPKVEEAYPFVKDNVEETPKPAEPDWKQDQALLMQQAQRIKQFNKDKGGGS